LAASGSGAPVPDAILSVRDLSKSFGSTRALEGFSLDIAPGEVHALLGQNGSGKSTLIKILAGYHSADRGTVAIRGEPVSLPLRATGLQRQGLAFVHQDLGLVETLSVIENLRVGRFETGAGWRIRWRSERQRARGLLHQFGLDVDPSIPVARLSRTERAILAIIRALDEMGALGAGEARCGGLLVLDEPTASLPEDEVRLLFDAMGQVKAAGSSVLYVTHRLEEVFAVADTVTVLRDGQRVATEPVARLDEHALIALILGRDFEALYPEADHRVADPLLGVEGLTGSICRDVSFALRRREVLGVTGLVGAGFDELPYLVHGSSPRAAGTIALEGRPIPSADPARSRKLGLALLPADRQRQAGIPRATVKENVTLPVLRHYRRLGRLEHRRERRDVRALLGRFHIRPPDPDRTLVALSGGNQQKALLARWISTRPRVLLLHEPAQGVDIGSRREIFALLESAVESGTAVLYASAEHEELAHLCDRVLVFHRGRIVRELAGPSVTKDSIAAACYGQAG
jgi:ribose transport system ATP-binding protein